MAHGFGDLLGGPDRAAIEVHEPPVRHGVGKDHTATAPIPCGMRPGTRRRIADAQLLRQLQGNTALLQVGFAAAAGQGSLEGRELLSQVGTCWSRRTWRWSACRWRARGGGSMPVAYERWNHSQAALAPWQQRQGRARWQPRGLEALGATPDEESKEGDGETVVLGLGGVDATRARSPALSQ